MSSFRPEEVAALEECGNAAFAEAFLARYQGTPPRPVDRSQPRVGEWIRAVYEERRFLDPSKLKPCQTGQGAPEAREVGAAPAAALAPPAGLTVAVDEGSIAPPASAASPLPSPSGPFASLSSLPPGLAGSHGSFAAHQTGSHGSFAGQPSGAYGSFAGQPSGTFAPSPSLQSAAGFPGSPAPSFTSAGSAPVGAGYGAAGSFSGAPSGGPTGFGNGAMPKPKSRSSLQSMAHKASKMTKSAFGVSSKKSFKSAGHLDGFGPDSYGEHAGGAYAQGAPSPTGGAYGANPAGVSGPAASGFSGSGSMVGFGSGGVVPQGDRSGSGLGKYIGLKGGSFGSKRGSGSFNHGNGGGFYQGGYGAAGAYGAGQDERMSARERRDLDAAIAASLVTAGVNSAGPDAARAYASDPFSAPSFSRRPASAEAAARSPEAAPAQAPAEPPAPEPKKPTSVDDIPVFDLLGDSFTAPAPPALPTDALSGAGSPAAAVSPVNSLSPATSTPAPAPAPAADGWADFGVQPAAAAKPATPASSPPPPPAAAAPSSPPAGWDSFDAAPTAAPAPTPAAKAPAAASSPPKPPVRREPVPLDVFFPEFEQIRATGLLPNGQPVPRPGMPLSPGVGGGAAWMPAASGIAATATKGLVPGLSPPVVGGAVRANGAGAASGPAAPLQTSSSAGALNSFPGALQAALPPPGQAPAYGYGSPTGTSSGPRVTFASPVSSTGYSMGSPASPPPAPAPAQAQQTAGLGSLAGLAAFDAPTTSPALASGNPFA